jgi:hypothetical protein
VRRQGEVGQAEGRPDRFSRAHHFAQQALTVSYCKDATI